MFKKNEQDTVTPRNKFMFLAAIAASFSLAMLATTSAPQENNVAPLSGVSSVTTTTNENSLAYAALSVERHPKKQVPSWQMITPYMVCESLRVQEIQVGAQPVRVSRPLVGERIRLDLQQLRSGTRQRDCWGCSQDVGCSPGEPWNQDGFRGERLED